MEAEIKNFEDAREILAEIWSESIINPVKAAYIDLQERSIDTTES